MVRISHAKTDRNAQKPEAALVENAIMNGKSSAGRDVINHVRVLIG